MNCQQGHCDYTARVWLTRGGRARKVCTTHAQELQTKGWVLR